MWEGEVAGKEGNGWMDGYVIGGLGSRERRWRKAEVGKGREKEREEGGGEATEGVKERQASRGMERTRRDVGGRARRREAGEESGGWREGSKEGRGRRVLRAGGVTRGREEGEARGGENANDQ